jgi:hypothetical protein
MTTPLQRPSRQLTRAKRRLPALPLRACRRPHLPASPLARSPRPCEARPLPSGRFRRVCASPSGRSALGPRRSSPTRSAARASVEPRERWPGQLTPPDVHAQKARATESPRAAKPRPKTYGPPRLVGSREGSSPEKGCARSRSSSVSVSPERASQLVAPPAGTPTRRRASFAPSSSARAAPAEPEEPRSVPVPVPITLSPSVQQRNAEW